MVVTVVDEIEKVQPRIVSLDDRTARDKALVVAAKNGDGQAFEILVRRYRSKMLRVALRFTRNEADAEDIVQQSFQKAFVHLQQFEGHSTFSTWLTRIAINQALMWLRRKISTVEIPLEQSNVENGATLSLDFPDSRVNPEDSCAQQEQKEILSAALDKLTPGMRKAIQLREIDELSTKEAARVMGISTQAVKARVFHGRKKIAKSIQCWMSRPQTWRVTYRGQAISRNAVSSACS
jgi:RNA polymerase sigma-70 factor (ECF subfamily)